MYTRSRMVKYPVVVSVFMLLVGVLIGQLVEQPWDILMKNASPLTESDELVARTKGGIETPEHVNREAEEQTSMFTTYKWDWKSDNTDALDAFLAKERGLSSELQNVVIDKQWAEDSYNGQRENATFLILCRNDDLFELLGSIRSVQDRFNHKYNYDFTFLNDKTFSAEFISTIAHFVPQGKLNFGEIPRVHWSYPDFVNQTYAAERRQEYANSDVLYGSSESYRFMCRYYSGFFYKHPLVKQYEYYWRLEPDINYLCDINYDLFKFMKSNNKKYAFAISMFEYEATVPTLWLRFKEFVASHQNESQGKLIGFVQNDDKPRSYNLCHFWSNFEIASLSLFDEHYDELFTYLDRTGGFFYERWGDAPIHTLAVTWLLDKDEVWWFNDIGYYHPPYTQCPSDKMTRFNNRCSCDPDDDFTYSFISCIPHFVHFLST